MVGYYRNFTPNFSDIAAPLTDNLRGKGNKLWKWNNQCQEAFEELRRALCKDPVPRTSNFQKTFRVATDTSGKGLGTVLSQEFEGEEHPIIYLSQKLTPTETRYSTIEREALAVKWALETLRYYLLGAPFELVTDHAPLTWLNRMKDSNARLTRWYLSLQPYKFTVTYKKGRSHVNANFLSRQDNQGLAENNLAAAPILPGEDCDREL